LDVDFKLSAERDELICWSGLAVIAVLYLWTAGLTDYLGPNSDSLTYIYHSVWYSRGGEPWLSDFVRSSPFPPGFPIWLSAFGAAPGNDAAAIIANSVAFVLSLVAFSLLVRTYGITGLANLAVCAVAYLSFGFFSFTRSVGSEGLYMAFAFGALVLLRTTQDSVSRQKSAAAALMVAAAYLIRSIGFLLIVAYLANEFRSRRLQVFPMIVMLVPVICWVIIANLLFDGSRSYVAQFLSLNPIENIPAWVASNVSALAVTLKNYSGWHMVLAVALFAAVVANVVRRSFKLDPVAIYFLGYVVVVTLWPYPSHMERFFLPLWPLTVLFLFDFIQSMGPLPKVWKRAVAGAFGVVLLGGSMVQLVNVSQWDFPEELAQYRYTTPIMVQTNADDALRLADYFHRGILVATETSRFVKSGQCVTSIVPHLVSFYSQRQVARILLGAPHGDTMRKLSFCPFVFVFGLESDSWEGSLFYPVDLPSERENFHPLLISKTESGEIAAALFAYTGGARMVQK
jgi:hypothetical protein